jgi:hypothetical protein
MEPPPSIYLHIDRVILDGLPFTTGDAAPIRAELETEIPRLLTDQLTTSAVTSLALDTLLATRVSLNSKRANFGREIATGLNAALSEALAVPPRAL